VALSDPNGNLVETYSYDVFGQPNTIGSKGNPYLFTGQRYDEETRLYYYRMRYYSPSLGRFLQSDPIGYADSLNIYTYCENNPVNWADPYGLCKGGSWLNWTQGGLDVIGIFDPTGIADLLNAVIYAGRGQWGNAAISAGAIIPYIGDFGKGGKYGIKALKYSDEITDARLVIGKMDDLKNIRRGEKTLLNNLTPDLGSPKLNWKRNFSLLRKEMRSGIPIRDATVDTMGRRINNTGFLRAERNVLENKGWIYDSTTRLYSPFQ